MISRIVNGQLVNTDVAQDGQAVDVLTGHADVRHTGLALDGVGTASGAGGGISKGGCRAGGLLTILILLEGEGKIVERADGASALVGVAAGVLGVGEGAGLARRQGDAQAVVQEQSLYKRALICYFADHLTHIF